jgi:hypothetical protein
VIYVGFVDEDKFFRSFFGDEFPEFLPLGFAPFLEGVFTRRPKLPYPGK